MIYEQINCEWLLTSAPVLTYEEDGSGECLDVAFKSKGIQSVPVPHQVKLKYLRTEKILDQSYFVFEDSLSYEEAKNGNQYLHRTCYYIVDKRKYPRLALNLLECSVRDESCWITMFLYEGKRIFDPTEFFGFSVIRGLYLGDNITDWLNSSPYNFIEEERAAY